MSMADVDYSRARSINNTDKGSQFTLVGMVTFGASGLLALLSILNMAISSSTVVLIGSIVGLVVAPTAFAQRYQLSKMATLREVHNRLRAEVNELTLTNDDLASNVDKLQENVDRVSSLETQLGQVVEQQGGNAAQFINLVKENSVTLNKMQKLLEAEVLNQGMFILCQVDRDQGFDIDPHEITELILRLRALPGVVDVNEEAIRTALTKESGESADMSRIITFIRRLKEEADTQNSTFGQHEEAKKFFTVSSRKLVESK